MFDEPQLAALCLETIDKNTPEALGIDLYIRNIFCKPNQKIPLKLYTFQQNISFLGAEGFTDIDINTLGAVLDRDSLRIKEAKLFAGLFTFLKYFV